MRKFSYRWKGTMALTLAVGFIWEMIQPEANGLSSVNSLVKQSHPERPVVLPQEHTHEEFAEEFPSTLTLVVASGANVSAQISASTSELSYELNGVITVPPLLPPLPPLHITVERLYRSLPLDHEGEPPSDYGP
jgi:hypothetical protein